MTTIAPLLRVHYKSTLRDKTALFFTFAFPLLFIVIFGLLFGSTKTSGGQTVIDTMAPGVMSWGVGNAAVFGLGYNLVQWRSTDLLRMIRRTPTPLTSFLASRFVVVLGVALAQAVLFLAVASIPPFDLHTTPLGLLAGLPVLVCGALAFYAIGLLVGNLARTPDAIAAIANCLMVPMAFLSGSFFPLSQSPAWLKAVSRVLPLRYMNDGFDAVLDGQGHYGTMLVSCVILLAFTAVFGYVAFRTFRWENAK
jgi:ABC-2 type transport system permease protein